jgi:hypothetical protein
MCKLSPLSISLTPTDRPSSVHLDSNKAVSDGAVAFHLSSMVQARIAKHSYGTLQNVEYDPVDPEHIARFSKLLVRASGRKLVPCGFAAMLAKVC